METVKDLEQAAKDELLIEDEEMVKEEIKERLREIRCATNILDKLKKKYADFLKADPDDLL